MKLPSKSSVASAPDREILAAQAYERLQWGGEVLRRAERFRRKSPGNFAQIAPLYDWFLRPMTLWPCNICDLLGAALDFLETGRPLDVGLRLFLEMLPPRPSAKATEVTARHEHDVQAGRYEHLVNAADAKYAAEADALARVKELRADWRKIKAAYPVGEFADHKGLIRRGLVSERNLRPDFTAEWSEPARQFQVTFDAFCIKWNLYGMQNDRPLLLKLSVNLTPAGTMIFVPSYWSLDFKRDFNFKAISQLHRARVPHRQGPAIAEGRRERRIMAKKLRDLDAEVKALGLKGEKKNDFLCEKLGRNPGTDAKYFARLRKDFPEA